MEASPLSFGFEEQRAQRQAERLFWCRGCAVSLSVTLLLPLFALAARSLDDLAPWEADAAWYSMEGETENPYVCQRGTTNASCEGAGWVASAEGDKCWKVFAADPTTWARAEQRCQRSAGTLAAILSEAENAEVHRVCGARQPCWIGLTRPAPAAEFWTWTDRSAPTIWLGGDEEDPAPSWVDSSSPAYARWSDGEPGGVECAVVIGMHRVNVLAAGAAAEDAAAQIFLMFVNVAIMTVVCGVVYQAMLAKSSSLMMCAVASDGSCALCCCLWVFLGIGPLLQGDGSAARWLTIGLGLLQLITLVGLCFFGLHFNQNELKAPAIAPQVTIGEVSVRGSGTGSVGSMSSANSTRSSGTQVVVGRPMHAQGYGGPEDMAAMCSNKSGNHVAATGSTRSGNHAATTGSARLPMRLYEVPPELS